LGHRLTCDLKDNEDIDQQKRLFCVRANILAHKFGKCSTDVKRLLFKTFCSNLYGCQLWCTYRKSNFSTLRVCYNTAFRRLLGYAHDHSVSAMFVSNGVNTFQCLYRKLIYSFMERLRTSCNTLVFSIFRSDVYWRSGLLKHWSRMVH
jgi:hypothetical protein